MKKSSKKNNKKKNDTVIGDSRKCVVSDVVLIVFSLFVLFICMSLVYYSYSIAGNKAKEKIDANTQNNTTQIIENNGENTN